MPSSDVPRARSTSVGAMALYVADMKGRCPVRVWACRRWRGPSNREPRVASLAICLTPDCPGSPHAWSLINTTLDAVGWRVEGGLRVGGSMRSDTTIGLSYGEGHGLGTTYPSAIMMHARILIMHYDARRVVERWKARKLAAGSWELGGRG